jgi:hypothetical protein
VTLCYLGKEVVDAVDGQVEGRETAGEEAPPPPVVILTAEDMNTPTTISSPYTSEISEFAVPDTAVIYYAVLRIRDVYPGSRTQIQGQKDSGSA